MEKNNNIATFCIGTALVSAAKDTVAEEAALYVVNNCGYAAAKLGGEVALDLLELIGGSVAPILIIGGLAVGIYFSDF